VLKPSPQPSPNGRGAQSTKHKVQSTKHKPLKYVLTLFGIILAAVGGVIAYRAYFLDPKAAVIITSTDIREVPDYFRIVIGLVLLVVGAGMAYTAALRKR